MKQNKVDQIAAIVADAFPTFGGTHEPSGDNPIEYWQQGGPAIFALGVDVRAVVARVLQEDARLRRKAARKR